MTTPPSINVPDDNQSRACCCLFFRSRAAFNSPTDHLTSDQSLVVREQVADCFGIDVSRVVTHANFFQDLGGTSDHLKTMRLAIEAALDVAIATSHTSG